MAVVVGFEVEKVEKKWHLAIRPRYWAPLCIVIREH